MAEAQLVCAGGIWSERRHAEMELEAKLRLLLKPNLMESNDTPPYSRVQMSVFYEN